MAATDGVGRDADEDDSPQEEARKTTAMPIRATTVHHPIHRGLVVAPRDYLTPIF
jgi:hypothetical protein